MLNKGGGSNRLPVEFPQVQTSNYNYSVYIPVVVSVCADVTPVIVETVS